MLLPDEEIDPLLAGYLDQELSLEETALVEQCLLERPELVERLANWRANQNLLKNLRNPAVSLPSSFTERVLKAAQSDPAVVGDPGLAPWIPRENQSLSVEPASKIQSRNRDSDRSSPGSWGRWWLIRGTLVLGTAACVMIGAFLIPLKTPTEIHRLGMQTSSGQTDTATIELESHPSTAKSMETSRSASIKGSKGKELDDPALPSVQSENLAASATSREGENQPRSMQDPVSQPGLDRSPTRLSDSASPFSVAPDLQLTPEQRKMVEALSPTAPGAFVFVIDVSLPKGIRDTDSLQAILERNDIPWASQLNIDEVVRRKLVGSRMISEAAEQGLLSDAVPVNPSEQRVGPEESVSLIFVKGRGKRLDKALIEIMQRIDDFPEFSFDLAFDPPIQSMVEELRFIQEASLATTASQASGAASAVRIRSETEPSERGSLFTAAPRRSPAMHRTVRLKASGIGDTELMNPVAYALLIVRHSK
jgi:hypothetical protein